MRDLPAGPALLTLARTVLTEELLPLLPRERQLDGRLIAAAMAIAEREAAAGEGPAERIGGALERFYGGSEAVLDGIEKSPHPEPARSAASKDAPAYIQPSERSRLWRRFAQDLRCGAFEDEDQSGRAARAVLWRLTIAKLRAANPRFLALNGFSDQSR